MKRNVSTQFAKIAEIDSKSLELLFFIYIGQRIRPPGIVYYKDGSILNSKKTKKSITVLSEKKLITINRWNYTKYYPIETTKRADKICKQIEKTFYKNSRNQLFKILDSYPENFLGLLLHQRFKLYDKNDRLSEIWGFYVHPLEKKYVYLDDIFSDEEIWKDYQNLLRKMHKIGLSIITKEYVSTRGGEPREKCYVFLPIIHKIFNEYCQKKKIPKITKKETYAVVRDFLKKPSFPDNLHDWDFYKIKHLIDIGYNESINLDFKYNLPGGDTLTKLCCAFANTEGGFIIFGVKENKNKFDIVGIDHDKEISHKFGQKLNCIPKIIFPTPKFIAIPETKKFLVVFYIPKNLGKPNIPTPKEKRIFWKRTNQGNDYMDYHEIERMFTKK